MPPKKKKEAQVKGDEAEKVILEYLEQQYRPYSVNDIVQNLHGATARPAAQKALDTLTEEGKIVTKQFGKISVSVANKVEVDSTDNKINNDEKLEKLKESAKKLQQELTQLQNDLSEITKIPTDEETQVQLESLKNEISLLSGKIESANSKPSLSPDSVEKIKDISNSITKESKKRLKLYQGLLNYIAEFIDPKKLVNDLGLEEVNQIKV